MLFYKKKFPLDETNISTGQSEVILEEIPSTRTKINWFVLSIGIQIGFHYQ